MSQIRRPSLFHDKYSHDLILWRVLVLLVILIFIGFCVMRYLNVSPTWRPITHTVHHIPSPVLSVWRILTSVVWTVLWHYKWVWLSYSTFILSTWLSPNWLIACYDLVAWAVLWLVEQMRKLKKPSIPPIKIPNNQHNPQSQQLAFPPTQPQSIPQRIAPPRTPPNEPTSVTALPIPKKQTAVFPPLPGKLRIDVQDTMPKFFLKPSLPKHAQDALNLLISQRNIKATFCRDGCVVDKSLPSVEVLRQPREYYVRADLWPCKNELETLRHRTLKLGDSTHECIVLTHPISYDDESLWLNKHRHLFEGSAARLIYDGIAHNLPIVGGYVPHALYVSKEFLNPLIEKGILTSTEVAALERKRIWINKSSKPTFLKIVREEDPMC
jgi:hypothetical protein